MPTYRYECEACGHGFELFQSMTDKVKRKCPECGKSQLVRLIGAGAGVIFKGSGFYQTDYKSSGRPTNEGGGNEGGSSGSDSSTAPPSSTPKASDSHSSPNPPSPPRGKADGKTKSE